MKSNRIIFIYTYSLCLILFVFSGCSKKDVTPINFGPTVTDVDGNVYHSVKIGTQVWMVENLRTTKYSNGDLIGTQAAPESSWQTTPKYQWIYNGNESSAATYGRLYTWFAATDIRKIAPTGWHVPNSREWMTLINFLGGANVAGGQLKAKGETLWKSPNSDATNFSGFTALPGGFWNGAATQIGESANWWSVASSLYVNNRGDFFNVNKDTGEVLIWDFAMDAGMSIRCVQD